jgi:hypothetical protein
MLFFWLIPAAILATILVAVLCLVLMRRIPPDQPEQPPDAGPESDRSSRHAAMESKTGAGQSLEAPSTAGTTVPK